MKHNIVLGWKGYIEQVNYFDELLHTKKDGSDMQRYVKWLYRAATK